MPRPPGEVPLMRASVVKTFLVGLSIVEQDIILKKLDLSRKELDDVRRFLAAETVYSVVEWCAELKKDPSFGLKEGLAVKVEQWPPFQEATVANVLVEFLARFASNVSHFATSTRYVLEMGPTESTFRQIRTFEPTMLPSQADAFNAGLMINILKSATGQTLDISKTSLQVCNSQALKGVKLGCAKITNGNRKGIACQFPSEWLWLGCSFSNLPVPRTESPLEDLPTNLPIIVKQLLDSGIPLTEINSSRIAQTLGLKQRSIREQLKAQETSLKQILETVKREQSIDMLGRQGLSVAQTAEKLGYSDPANFARAFRKMTGKSPKSAMKPARQLTT